MTVVRARLPVSRRGRAATSLHGAQPLGERDDGGPRDRRRDTGDEAEALAATTLREHGYRIVGRSVRVGRFELDLVAWDGEVLCFVEVKARVDARDYGGAVGSVSHDQRVHITRAAARYLARLRAKPRCRFDVVAVDGTADAPVVTVVRGAFRAGE